MGIRDQNTGQNGEGFFEPERNRDEGDSLSYPTKYSLVEQRDRSEAKDIIRFVHRTIIEISEMLDRAVEIEQLKHQAFENEGKILVHKDKSNSLQVEIEERTKKAIELDCGIKSKYAEIISNINEDFQEVGRLKDKLRPRFDLPTTSIPTALASEPIKEIRETLANYNSTLKHFVQLLWETMLEITKHEPTAGAWEPFISFESAADVNLEDQLRDLQSLSSRVDTYNQLASSPLLEERQLSAEKRALRRLKQDLGLLNIELDEVVNKHLVASQQIESFLQSVDILTPSLQTKLIQVCVNMTRLSQLCMKSPSLISDEIQNSMLTIAGLAKQAESISSILKATDRAIARRALAEAYSFSISIDLTENLGALETITENYLVANKAPPARTPSLVTESAANLSELGFGRKIIEESPKSSVIILLRPYITRDLEEVVKIEKATNLAPWDARDITEQRKSHDASFMIAEVAEQIVGFMVFKNNRPAIELIRLAVSPKFQRLGYGHAMVKKLFCKIRYPAHLDNIQVTVNERNLSGQLFLRACGFSATAMLVDKSGSSDDKVIRFIATRSVIEGLENTHKDGI